MALSCICCCSKMAGGQNCSADTEVLQKAQQPSYIQRIRPLPTLHVLHAATSARLRDRRLVPSVDDEGLGYSRLRGGLIHQAFLSWAITPGSAPSTAGRDGGDHGRFGRRDPT